MARSARRGALALGLAALAACVAAGAPLAEDAAQVAENAAENENVADAAYYDLPPGEEEGAYESPVVVLDDSNFEHLTQASTGQTTGVWFVKFYAPWCGHCKRLEPVWDELAEEFVAEGNPVIMAKVDAHNNAELKTRFSITGYPTLLLFGKQRMYAYHGLRGKDELRDWALGGFARLSGQEVPKPPSSVVVLIRRFEKWAAPHVFAIQRTMADASPKFWLCVIVCLLPVAVLVGGACVRARRHDAHRTRVVKRD